MRENRPYIDRVEKMSRGVQGINLRVGQDFDGEMDENGATPSALREAAKRRGGTGSAEADGADASGCRAPGC